ncbi:MAG: class I SAM-dependent methyltransferase [Bacteroidetes bacterium]|nr:class I SAM-dependent methyltransferase [Bacteroidota bacterium]
MSDERQVADASGRWWGEHIHRYNEALKLINENDVVLDIACGTGFGSDMIAQKSKGNVIGGDIAEEAIDECNSRWKRSNLSFKVLDGTNLDYPDNYFDKIVSFETIEHTGKYNEMAAEFARVLKPGGLLILSTPNREVSSPDGVIVNPYHIQEFTVDELQQILSKSFSSVDVSGQRYSRYDKKYFGKSIGSVFEKLFLSFGIRKLPYSFRSGFMKTFFGYPLYARDNDFVLEKDLGRIKNECPVQFAVCRK